MAQASCFTSLCPDFPLYTWSVTHLTGCLKTMYTRLVSQQQAKQKPVRLLATHPPFFAPPPFWASIETQMRKGSRLHPVFPSVCQAGQIIETAVFQGELVEMGVVRMMLAQHIAMREGRKETCVG